jgi:hypothetical protein
MKFEAPVVSAGTATGVEIPEMSWGPCVPVLGLPSP